MLETKNLRFKYDDDSELSFPDIKTSKENLLILGASGVGKTTFLHLLSGLLKPLEGEIDLIGTPISKLTMTEMDRFRGKNIGIVFQKPHFINSLTVKENLQLAQYISKKIDKTRINSLLESLGIEDKANKKTLNLSQGEKQRVSIARTLIMKPKFVVCDEPTSMLDVSIRISIMDLMLNLAKDLEVSYLYITHDLAVARYMCNRIAVMFNGKIVEIGETEELLQNPVHPYTKRLISSIPIPDPTYKREQYKVNFDELDNIISKNPNEKMVDIGGGHLVATHDTKDFLIES